MFKMILAPMCGITFEIPSDWQVQSVDIPGYECYYILPPPSLSATVDITAMMELRSSV